MMQYLSLSCQFPEQDLSVAVLMCGLLRTMCHGVQCVFVNLNDILSNESTCPFVFHHIGGNIERSWKAGLNFVPLSRLDYAWFILRSDYG
jgi:hypothetical protein